MTDRATNRLSSSAPQRAPVVAVMSKAIARRWGENLERELLINGSKRARKEVPTLEAFAPRFVDGHVRANRHQPSGVNHKQIIFPKSPGYAARNQAPGRDHKRRRSAAETSVANEGGSDGEQRAQRAEHDAEKSSRMAGD
jgi:hypothetical protein